MTDRESNRRRSSDRPHSGNGESDGTSGGTLVSRLTGALFGRREEPAEAAPATVDPLLDSAVTAMRSLGIKPTPPAYTIFYTHVSGERPQLSEEIHRIKLAGETFTPTRIAELYERFFGAEQEGLAAYEASRNVERLLSVVHEALSAAGDTTTSHGERISALHDELGRQEKVTEIRKVVAGILSETARMRMSINKLERRVVHSAAEIAELRDNLEQAQREANADPLTGIANRKMLEFELKRSAKEAAGGDKPFSVLMVDVDEFKQFNDEYGHQIGDHALKLVARTLAQGIKRRDLAARFGGEEFSVVLVETPLDGAIKLAENLRARIETTKLESEGVSHGVRPVTISIGVAQYREDEPLKRLVGRADRALYRAKEQGRNRVVSERDIEVHGRPKSRAKARA